LNSEYTPVSCALYDELELLAIRQNPAEIELVGGQKISILVKTIETRPSKEEFLIAATGQELRLDQIKTLNGKSFGEFC
jgi:transcriptional antiterminator Rof (Rho-off)